MEFDGSVPQNGTAVLTVLKGLNVAHLEQIDDLQIDHDLL